MMKLQIETGLETLRTGEGQTVLLLHGMEGLRRCDALIAALSCHAHVIASSHPGFGHSALAEEMRGIDDLSYFYLDLLERYDLRQVTLVGIGFGGWLAAEIAVRSIERLAGLVLIAPVGVKFSGREEREIADVFAMPAAQLSHALFHDPERWHENYADLSDADLEAIARDREAIARFAWSPYMHNPSLGRHLHRLRVPTLVLGGENDGVTPPAYARSYAAAIPGAKLKLLEKAGHFLHVERPEAVASAVLNFIKSDVF